MSERPGSREILERLRSARPTANETTPPAVPSAPSTDQASPGPMSVQEKLAAIRSQGGGAPARPAAESGPSLVKAGSSLARSERDEPGSVQAQAVQPDSSAGRPLSVKEKLAAARNASAPGSVAPAAKSGDFQAPTKQADLSSDRALSVKEKLAAARNAAPSAPAAPAVNPDDRSTKTSGGDSDPSRPLSVAEKLAKMRAASAGSGQAAAAAGSSSAEAVSAPPPKPPRPETVEGREASRNLRSRSEELNAKPLPKVEPKSDNSKNRPSREPVPIGQTLSILLIGVLALITIVSCLWYLLGR